jgi:transcriptional regulator with XRE-family HTH domain
MGTVTFRVRELREARGWSQRDLAERAGVRQATVHQLEAGKTSRVDLDTLARLANAFGVDAGYLIIHARA